MKFIIDEQNDGLRLDSFLAELMPDFSRTKIQKYIKEGKILLNNKSVKPSATTKEYDIITADDLELTNAAPEINPENIPLDIIWEDNNMAVINKPSGMLTHPTATEISGTLVNALMYKYGEDLSDINGYMRRGILHRLDRNTSGLIMIAKNNSAHEFLTTQMREKTFSKKYLTIVKGVIKEDYLEIETPIGRHPSLPHKMAAEINGLNVKDPKDAVTYIKVLKRFQNATYAEVQIITGRTHQIRVHMSSIGHPVYNDTLYGFGKMKIKTDEQVLQSYKLGFTKPFSDERINLEIPPDEKISKVLSYLEASEI